MCLQSASARWALSVPLVKPAQLAQTRLGEHRGGRQREKKKKKVFKELVYAGRTAGEKGNTEGFAENKQEQMIDKGRK